MGEADVDVPASPGSGHVPVTQLRAGSGGQKNVTVKSGCRSAPKWSLGGRSQRKEFTAKTPGPGAYSLQSGSRSGGVSWGKPTRPSSAGRLSVQSTSSPGPIYDTSVSGNVRGGAIGRRGRREENCSTPGPGDYSLPCTLSRSGLNMGPLVPSGRGSCRVKGGGDVLDLTPTRPTSAPPSWSFGTGHRPPLNAGMGVGAGELYVPPSTLAQGRAASLSGCKSASVMGQSEMRPDPGTYAVNQSTLSNGCRFGKAARPGSAPGRRQNVGPGSYDMPVQKSRGTGALASKMQRGSIASSAAGAVPGPGSYDPDKQGSFARGGSMAKAVRPGDAAVHSSGHREGGDPGPGEYGVPDNGRELGTGGGPRLPVRISSSFTKATEKDLEPGPGHYDTAAKGQGAKRAATMGTSKRPPLAVGSTTPDTPAAYDVASTFGTKAVTMTKGHRPSECGEASRPGPTDYAVYGSFG